MIGYFPDPYPDELFYSLCARYSQRMKYPDKTAANQELFGRFKANATIDLPGHLDFFTAALPPGHRCQEVNRLIEQHTLWPFYRPFLSVERQQLVLAAMRGETAYRPELHAGTVGTAIPRPEWLRFCPKCVAEDRAHLGECYWHRIHQLFGVHLCPSHEVLLENSAVGVGWRRTSTRFIAAEAVLAPVAPRLLLPSHPWYDPLLRLSRDAAWLLTASIPDLNQATLRKRYKILLAEQGWATYTGLVKRQRLFQALADFYPADLLAWLHCSLDDPVHMPWPGRLMLEDASVQPPLRHLLLIHFLGYTSQTFFALPAEFYPFGQGPWPCLNPICVHYQQPVINTYHLERRQHAQPVATFGCECGYRYRRKGPDRSIEDRLRGRCVEYGQVWDTELQRLWSDPTQSLLRTARHLGVTKQTLWRQAGRLGLPFPAPGSRLVSRSRRTPLPLAWVDPCSPLKPVADYRVWWLQVLADQPDLGRSQLRQAFRSLYNWLRRYDRDWLMAHLPPPRKRGAVPRPRMSPLDWHQRDLSLAQQVRYVAQQLRETPGRPNPITKTTIARHVKLLHPRFCTPDKLPLTTKALAEVTESWPQTTVRRIWWAVETYRQEGICPSHQQLRVRAGVRGGQNISPLIKEALEAALTMLNQNIYSP